MSSKNPISIMEERRFLEGIGPSLGGICAVFGVVVLGATFAMALRVEGGKLHFAASYLVNFSYLLSLSLGALIFVMLQHITRAGWSVAVRRPAEILAAMLPLLAIMFIPLLKMAPALYDWLQVPAKGLPAEHGSGGFKEMYLQFPFFIARFVAYFIVWSFLALYLFRQSVRQDATGDPVHTLRMERVSAVGTLLFAITITLASFDLLMSLDHEWYSTIFGVYYFSGAFVSALAFLILIIGSLQLSGRLTHAITVEHYHDLGKLLFAFIMFWAYIAFSQYMLIWYGNIPEETVWYYHRQNGGWATVGVILIFGHFVIPFLGLMSRHAKRNKYVLFFWAKWILLMHAVDLYWIVMPQFYRGEIPLRLLWIYLGCFVGLFGIFMAAMLFVARSLSLVPIRDPRLQESLSFESA
ncbi:MAG: quinol:cytochrome C oxidoreductase [bacterium]